MSKKSKMRRSKERDARIVGKKIISQGKEILD